MKKIYSFFTLLFACMIALPAFAETVVTKIGDPIKDMFSLKVGDKVLLYCNGPVDPADKEYGTRNAFLCEADEFDVNISRNLREGSLNSSDYIWEVIGCEATAEGDAVKIQFKSPRGNYLPNFFDDIDTYGQWARWMGRTFAEPDSVGTFTMSVASDVEGADTLFYFQDENGVFFNGQNLPKDATTGSANFVGWNTVGGNSLYMVYKPVVEDKTTYMFEFSMKDMEGVMDNGVDTVFALAGDTIQAPAWEHATFSRAENSETGEAVVFPYVVDAEKVAAENFFTLYYELWTEVSITCKDVDDPDNIMDFGINDFYPAGAKVAIPTAEQVGLGYKLVGPEEYVGKDSITVVPDDANYFEVELLYKRGTEGVPFKLTTVTDNKFAENTPWYVVHIRGNRALSYVEDTEAVYCAPTDDYTDAHLWAFEGDVVNGFKIYNKAAGAEKILWATDGNNATQLFMTPIVDTEGTANTFDLNYNNDGADKGFSFKLHETATSYINEFGGVEGEHVLKFWDNDGAKSDGGSRFKFIEYSEEWGEALRWAVYTSYVNAEGCVNGWTAEQLTELKAGIAAKDTMACRIATEALADMERIPFDVNKAYAVISASKGLLVEHPGKVFAMAMANDSNLVWKEFDVKDKAFHFGFNAVTDSTNYFVSVVHKRPVGSFRFNGAAKFVEWGGQPDSTSYAEGIPAPFQLVEVAHTPATYALVHNYGASKVTLTAMSDLGKDVASRDKAADSKATEGFVGTYNTLDNSFKNYWRLLPVGELTGIEDTVVANPGAQEEVIFDLSGRRVQKAVKGLYIVNGKKVYVK